MNLQSNTPGGPFGNYERGTLGHILNSMYHVEKVPLSQVDRFTIGWTSDLGQVMHRHGEVVACFKYFDGIEEPLFRWHWQYQDYNKQRFAVNEKGELTPMFRLMLSRNRKPGFIIGGVDATAELHDLIHRDFLSCSPTSVYADLAREAGASFEGGIDDNTGEYIFIEFSNAAGAKDWMNKLNQIYRPTEVKRVVHY